ncbi:hypothetical protein CBS115989_3048 [Aspergillus niger]|uniref:Uncharacterized protein n=2 Tax=Aspergillus niger TaxID=5061 RepID=A2Q7U6_ASPNC|nr:hypothetical protein An01g01990 [Aspergillus niger]KAI2821294.1 hypothetical protein CBS115989_3048 [Aspergillus niger]KAI2875723.1 hypothetical protein CBS115988_5162 [Aspergillus niger]CAK43569.1 hypothetical protein An01g01990 [Aspergillus niger]
MCFTSYSDEPVSPARPRPTSTNEQEGDEADDTMEEAMFLAQLVAEGEVGQAVVVVEEEEEEEEAAEEEEMMVEGEAEDEF